MKEALLTARNKNQARKLEETLTSKVITAPEADSAPLDAAVASDARRE